MSAVLLVRLVSLHYNTTALFFDEAQYWLWGSEPDFGYFSKPPVLGWTIALFTAVCGSDSEFCIRLPSPIIHTGTALLIFLSTARLFDRRTGFWAAVTFVLLPGITLSSTLISTDVPLLFCWAGALWAYLRLKESLIWSNAILLGLFIGIGLMSKYAMAYFFLCVIIDALFDRSARNAILSLKFLGSVLIALLILSPNIWWNSRHQFITASHTGDNIGWQGGLLHFDKAAEFIGSQFGVFGPILFAFFLIALIRFAREGWSPQQKFLVIFSLPVLALITFQALMSKAYANWAAVTYIAATILIADILVNRVPAIWNWISLSIHALIFAGLSIAVAFSAPGILTLPDGREPFERLQGWREISVATGKILDQSKYVGILGDHRHLTAELVYYLRHRSEKVFALKPSGAPHDHYQLTRPFLGLPKGPVLLVTSQNNIEIYKSQFKTILAKGSVDLSSGKFSRLWFFQLDDYVDNLNEQATLSRTVNDN
ncbi:MAG: phospholipid carrier-dependent glycosyltransferase [Hyphomicrobiales bacterium]|nr:phospholipid carrier-dependent glycosyltransferase [Hyphomicrobiales bacterium]